MQPRREVSNIAARLAVANVVHAYARAIRRNRPKDAAALFARDGWFEIREGHPDRPEHTVGTRLEGAAGVRDYLMPGKGRPYPVPLIHNLMVDVADATATATAMMTAHITGGRSGQRIVGEYHDTFVCEDGAWRFASRVFTIFGG